MIFLSQTCVGPTRGMSQRFTNDGPQGSLPVMQRRPLPASRYLPASVLAVVLALAACGGGGSGTPPPESATVGTVAYVDTECHEDMRSFSARQRLQVLRGDREPLTVAEIPT